MPVTTTAMNVHAASPAPISATPKVVLSRLGRGETIMNGAMPSLKLLLEGEELYNIDGRSHRLCAGRMLLIGPGAMYEATIRGERTRGLCVYIPSAAMPAGSLRSAELVGRTAMRAVDATAYGRALAQAAYEAHTAGAGWEAGGARIAKIAEAAMIGAIDDTAAGLENLGLKKIVTRRDVINRLEAARAYLHEIYDRPVPLVELAGVAGFSMFHLARYFSVVFGVSPGRYHRTLRLTRAEGLLRSGHHSATEVADLIGYAELSAFSHAFSREFGHPPSLA